MKALTRLSAIVGLMLSALGVTAIVYCLNMEVGQFKTNYSPDEIRFYYTCLDALQPLGISGTAISAASIVLNIVSRIKKVQGNLLIVLAIIGILVGISATIVGFAVK
jgi:hypothetical protein